MRAGRDLTAAPVGRATFLFGLPIAAALAFHGLFNLVDLYFVGRLGVPGVVAAVNVASVLVTAPLLLFDGVCNAAVAFTARARGAGDAASVHAVGRETARLAVVASVLTCFPFFPAAAAALEGFRFGDARATEAADQYLRISSFGASSMFLLMAATAVFRGVGAAAWPVGLLVGANALNLVLDVGFVFGRFGLPRLEAAGAAWATVVARAAATLVAGVALARGAAGLDFRRRRTAVGAAWGALLRKGVPTSLQLVVRIASFVWVLRIADAAARDSAAALDGVNVAQRIDMTAVFVALGWGSAATTVVGQNLGAGRPDRARRATWWLVGHAAGSMVLAGAAFWAFRGACFAAIKPDLSAEALRCGEDYWRATLPALPALAAGAVLARALNGALDVRTPLLIDVAWYLILLPCAAAAATGVGFAGILASETRDASAAWVATAAAHVGAAATYVVAFLRSKPLRDPPAAVGT